MKKFPRTLAVLKVLCYNEDMEKFLTDLHTHTTFSHDGKNTPIEMLEGAREKGIAFYGVNEHFDYDYDLSLLSEAERRALKNGDEGEYFHTLRHLQEDYGGVMNVAVGAEFGYSEKEEVQGRYASTYEKYHPDYVINSVHGQDGKDYARYTFTQDKTKTYGEYLRLVRRSLDAPYPYDIVGHVGYIVRYAPFADARLSLAEFGERIDDILLTIVRKGKILEVNTAIAEGTLPTRELVKRYFELGGRKVSYGSDAHKRERIGDKREEATAMLREIGFTCLTVPFRGEHIEVKL